MKKESVQNNNSKTNKNKKQQKQRETRKTCILQGKKERETRQQKQQQRTYSIIKPQEIGDNFHVVIKLGLEADHFTDDVPKTSREDQQWNVVLMKLIKKPCASIPK